MREIKFKAFCKKENKIYDVQSIEFVDLIEGRTGINVYIGEDIKDCKWLEEGEYVLMQFTGLKDKNGKEIYEGDVVDISLFNGNAIYRMPINDIMQMPNEMYGSPVDWFEVIGNIYENPELLIK